jgi:hypothetical protein
MQHLFASLVCLSLMLTACSGVPPTAPSRPPPPAPPTPVPTPPRSPVPFVDRYTEITVGAVVQSVVQADDPLCAEEPLWPCKYFRITPPRDGTLEVELTHTGGNLDLSFYDIYGGRWWYPIRVPVKAGATYQIAIWEYEYPGLAFVLRTSLEPI